jgi:hypothetical protein
LDRLDDEAPLTDTGQQARRGERNTDWNDLLVPFGPSGLGFTLRRSGITDWSAGRSRFGNTRGVSTHAGDRSRRFWWVNQSQTHREEVAGGFMWSPKRNANGARNQFYEYMREVEPGDIVFSFFDTQIQGIGVVTARADTAPKPEFGPAGQSNNWSQEGWLVAVE